MLALQRKHIVDLDELLGPTSPPGLLNTEELVSQSSLKALSNLSCSQISICQKYFGRKMFYLNSQFSCCYPNSKDFKDVVSTSLSQLSSVPCSLVFLTATFHTASISQILVLDSGRKI